MFGTFLLYFFIAQTSHATTTTDSCPYGYAFSLELDDCLGTLFMLVFRTHFFIVDEK